MIDPNLIALVEKTVYKKICRNCYHRNPINRTTCRKCKHNDLRFQHKIKK